MSLLKNMEKIANFIQQKYSALEFGNISVSNEAIIDISNVILNKYSVISWRSSSTVVS